MTNLIPGVIERFRNRCRELGIEREYPVDVGQLESCLEKELQSIQEGVLGCVPEKRIMPPGPFLEHRYREIDGHNACRTKTIESLNRYFLG